MVVGVAEYVSAYRAADLTRLRQATARSAPRVTIDEVMKPAVRRSVQQGAMWGGAVLVVGLGGTLVARKRSRRA